MTRVARAANQLAEQILTHWEDATITVVGEPDGYNVLRQLLIEAPVGEKLLPVLEPITSTDRRIDSLYLSDEGDLTVSFTASRHGDDTDPFPIEAVLRVQNEAEADVNGPPADEEPVVAPKPTPVKRAARKRTAAKDKQ